LLFISKHDQRYEENENKNQKIKPTKLKHTLTTAVDIALIGREEEKRERWKAMKKSMTVREG
jgi:hypothetical protein